MHAVKDELRWYSLFACCFFWQRDLTPFVNPSIFSICLLSASRQRDSEVIGAGALQSSSLIPLKKLDLNTAGPEMSCSHQSKRKRMGSVRILKTGVVLPFLLALV